VSASLAYAQVRMQSRYGARATPGEWQRLLAITDYRAFLEQARHTGLKPWLSNVSPIGTAHEMEQLLRGQWRAHIAELARWLPASYAAVLAWSLTLPDLPALAHLLGGGESYAWMLDEPALKTLAVADAAARAALLVQTGFAPLAGEPSGLPPIERWLRVWQRRLPPATRRERRQVQALVRLLLEHRRVFLPSPAHDPPGTPAAAALRREFETRIVTCFRRGFLAPSGVLAYLALAALECERARAALAVRAWFPAEQL